ncbi:MAG: alanine--tRNA ligase [Hydrogenibacillus sp.]|nr:alanine--tRNA ligase [Hydrogenibacillus sp.]
MSMKGQEIREKFLAFFEQKGHTIIPPASLIPIDDPSLLWINSGVATLKKYFDGREVPPNPRLVNVQKSIRTNDIENVGKTARHHTLFEMLGNFSIGDYFKREAILWAWEFLTERRWIGFDPDRLSVTIHPEDDEAYEIWRREIGLPDARIIRLEGNFWDIGEGPSGPNSEIFYDRGPAYGDDPNDPELYPGGENERYLEIWNLVFSQFNHNPDGTYTPLPSKNIDTGMGLERMASILQDGETNFDTDLFLPIIRLTESLSGVQYRSARETDIAFRVVADHIRALAFAVGDGALPSNEGRGYVLRRLLRRAVRYGRKLGFDRPFLYRLVPAVGEIMGAFYPEIPSREAHIADVVRREEERFYERLDEGMRLIEETIAKAKREGRAMITGEEAFVLYDTYGFPLDLTEDMATEHGLAVDREGFEQAMAKQRERARSARGAVDSMQVQGGELRDFVAESRFVGYERLIVPDARVIGLFVDGRRVESLAAGEEGLVFLDVTPFYAESGGQIADRGVLVAASEGDAPEGVRGSARDTFRAEVLDVTKAPHGQHAHRVRVVRGTLRVGDVVRAEVDAADRADVIKNHTATHLLHQALRDVLGPHVSQAGSLVAPDRLRFDFSHYGPLAPSEVERIERIVNEKIWQAIPVEWFYKPLDEAKAMGAMALFGEKYGEIVRVVRVGDYSLELCGGCHVTNTLEIGLFKITGESGIGAGVRRIEAVTGRYAYAYVTELLKILAAAAESLKAQPVEVPAKLEGLKEMLRDKERENERLKDKLARYEALELWDQARKIGEMTVLTARVDVPDMDALRKLLDELKASTTGQSGAVIVLGAESGGRALFAASVSSDLVQKGIHAGQLLKKVAAIAGGSGGGRPEMAQAGGRHAEKLDEALQAVFTFLG